MNTELVREERNWAMAARLCGLSWLAGGTGLILLWILGAVNLLLVIIAAVQVRDGKPYRDPVCLRLVK